jgi:hypothetical protein
MNANATVVSILPAKVNEEKPGLYPGTFQIPAAKDGDFNILHVGVSHYIVYLDSSRGSLRVPELGSKIARSIVEDFIKAQIGVEDGREPGLFWVEGHLTKEEILAKHKDLLEQAKEKQKNWFTALVMLGDDNWVRYGTHSAISGVQITAAKSLGHKAEWVL